jgi:hypothetical protein
VPTLISQLQQSDVLRIYNALLALRKLVKRFEYKAQSERGPLNDILQYAFPYLQGLMTHILTHNSLEAASVMRLCLKIFWSSTNYLLPRVTGVDVGLWFNCIAQIMMKRLPEASENVEPLGQPLEVEERKQWPWWKVSTSLFLSLCMAWLHICLSVRLCLSLSLSLSLSLFVGASVYLSVCFLFLSFVWLWTNLFLSLSLSLSLSHQ